MAVASDLPPAREQAAVPQRAQVGAVRLSGAPARCPGRQQEQDPGHGRPDLTRHAARDHRHRGPALLREPGRRRARDRARAAGRRQARRQRSGRFDDHPAVRQERAGGAEQPDRVPEAPRGRARLPPDPQVDEGARSSPSTSTRSTSATAPTASSPPPGSTSAATTAAAPSPARQRHLRRPPDSGAGRAAGRDGGLAVRLRPRRPSAGGHAATQLRAAQDAGPGIHHPRGVRDRHPRGAAQPRQHPAADRVGDRANRGVLRLVGASSRSSTASAPSVRSTAG